MNRLTQKAEARRRRFANIRAEHSAVNQKAVKPRPPKAQASRKLTDKLCDIWLLTHQYTIYKPLVGAGGDSRVVFRDGVYRKVICTPWPAKFDMVHRKLKYSPKLLDPRTPVEKTEYAILYMRDDGEGQLFD